MDMMSSWIQGSFACSMDFRIPVGRTNNKGMDTQKRPLFRTNANKLPNARMVKRWPWSAAILAAFRLETSRFHVPAKWRCSTIAVFRRSRKEAEESMLFGACAGVYTSSNFAFLKRLQRLRVISLPRVASLPNS
ncbi:MAG: hypothetical protein ACRER2_18720 [Methylococcales bacterium]